MVLLDKDNVVVTGVKQNTMHCMCVWMTWKSAIEDNSMIELAISIRQTTLPKTGHLIYIWDFNIIIILLVKDKVVVTGEKQNKMHYMCVWTSWKSVSLRTTVR